MSAGRATGRDARTTRARGFATRLLAWWDIDGRKDLPWQRRPSAYRVWVSEIMLQQTRVATVVPYFRRFVRRFPGVRALADAAEDDVLAHWSGLGYYARARNLHRAARAIVERHGGRFPRRLDDVGALPGIGRSTAGAILALACGERHAILDGNVKRVLSRHAGVDGWPGDRDVERALWRIAEERLPHERIANYTQALMDLGATLCVPRAPGCTRCPVADDCVARRDGRTAALPAPRPRKASPTRTSVFVVARARDGAVLLERRPPSGIWGGLWSFPECDAPEDAAGRLARLGIVAAGPPRALAPVRHAFTHFRLEATPLLFEVAADGARARDDDATRWLQPGAPARVGLAAPVARLVASLPSRECEEDP